jgi:hypothetical protein
MKAIDLIKLVGMAALVGACGTDLGTSDKDDTDTDLGGDSAGETDVGDTDDTDDTTPLAWDDSFWSPDWKSFVDCSDGSVTLSGESTRWGGDAQVYIAQTADFGDARGWDEVHTLAETTHSTNESGFTDYERTLTTGATLDGDDMQTEDVSTLFTCGADTNPPNDTPDIGTLDPNDDNFEVTFAVAVWAPGDDATTDDPADCVVFGNDADGLIADPGGHERPNAPDWLTDANCRTL